MDLKVNSINFNGKREILYGLTKASSLAQSIEFGRTAYSRDFSKINEHLVFNASMRAYLDMATKDDLFFNSIRTFTEKELNPIKDNLKEFTTQHGTLKPYDVFKQALESVIEKDRGNASTKKSAAEELLKILA